MPRAIGSEGEGVEIEVEPGLEEVGVAGGDEGPVEEAVVLRFQ